MLWITDITQITADHSTAILVDETPDYGVTPNPARNTLALFLFFYKRDVLNKFVEVEGIDNSIPVTVTQWSVSLEMGSGAYRSYLAAVPVYDDATAYDNGDYVWFSAQSRIYTYTEEGHVAGNDPTEDNSWEEVSLDNLRDLIITDPTVSNYYIGVVENFTTDKVEVCIAKSSEELADEIVDGVCKTLERALPTLLDVALLDGAWVKHYRKKNIEAQEIVDYLTDKCC